MIYLNMSSKKTFRDNEGLIDKETETQFTHEN